MIDGNVQWVCFGETCSCSGEEFECNCVALHGEWVGVCLCCTRSMVLIDADTGDVIEHKRASRK